MADTAAIEYIQKILDRRVLATVVFQLRRHRILYQIIKVRGVRDVTFTSTSDSSRIPNRTSMLIDHRNL